MATFEVKAYKIKIEPHPNADAIELAVVGEYRAIVPKGQLKSGDLAIYIPEAAIVPDWAIKRMGLEGRLAGKQHNRVKAIRLRGIVSQGLIFPLEWRTNVVDADFDLGTFDTKDMWVLVQTEGFAGITVEEGQDVMEYMGITKYEPPIPTCLSGEVESGFGYTLKYDIENWKKWPNVLEDGERVVFTEKIHGTWVCWARNPAFKNTIVTSKGLSDKGMILSINENNANNTYIKALDATGEKYNGVNALDRAQAIYGYDRGIYILGEVFGKGIQDLTYGDSTEHKYRVFDVFILPPNGRIIDGHYMNDDELTEFCENVKLERVPVLYRGPYGREVMMQYTEGKETVSGTGMCLREGIVINPTEERRDTELGRVKLKSVSDKYLTRKHGTDYN
jgi:RNA ligase (TIGR02306 family)